jgi:hypothetical protein
VVRCAPRLDARLVAAIAQFDDAKRPIAETNRRVRRIAEKLGLPSPSYEQVRVVVHQLRAQKRDPAIGAILLDISFQRRPPEALVEALAGIDPPQIP